MLGALQGGGGVWGQEGELRSAIFRSFSQVRNFPQFPTIFCKPCPPPPLSPPIQAQARVPGCTTRTHSSRRPRRQAARAHGMTVFEDQTGDSGWAYAGRPAGGRGCMGTGGGIEVCNLS